MHRILVVEDNEDTRNILRALLVHRGFAMLEAQSGEELLERIDGLDVDLIVLDIRLPGMDGCETLAQLRRNGFNKPVFMFSEYFDLFADRLRTCRPDGFFPKSKGPLGLIEAIEQRLAQSTSPR